MRKIIYAFLLIGLFAGGNVSASEDEVDKSPDHLYITDDAADEKKITDDAADEKKIPFRTRIIRSLKKDGDWLISIFHYAFEQAYYLYTGDSQPHHMACYLRQAITQNPIEGCGEEFVLHNGLQSFDGNKMSTKCILVDDEYDQDEPKYTAVGYETSVRDSQATTHIVTVVAFRSDGKKEKEIMQLVFDCDSSLGCEIQSTNYEVDVIYEVGVIKKRIKLTDTFHLPPKAIIGQSGDLANFEFYAEGDGIDGGIYRANANCKWSLSNVPSEKSVSDSYVSRMELGKFVITCESGGNNVTPQDDQKIVKSNTVIEELSVIIDRNGNAYGDIERREYVVVDNHERKLKWQSICGSYAKNNIPLFLLDLMW